MTSDSKFSGAAAFRSVFLPGKYSSFNVSGVACASSDPSWLKS